MIEKAKHIITNIVTDLEVGMVLTGKVVRILEFGAIVEFAPNKDGMVHISKLADKRIKKVEDVLSLDEEVTVKVIKVDTFKNRIDLSMRSSDLNN